MMFGAWTVRIPPDSTTSVGEQDAKGTGVTADAAIRSRSFWMLWLVLFTNVTAGIGVLGVASPMIQEMFGETPAAAAGFVGLLSLLNLLGRFAWSSFSDVIGRRRAYAIYFGLGIILYALIPATKAVGSTVLFIIAFCIIISMYGGGFATLPAYLKDVFGTKQVGAIHGRVLTAWSMAGIIGPTIVTYTRQAQIDRGVPSADAYSSTMYGLVGLLAIGFICNLFVRRVYQGPLIATPIASQSHVKYSGLLHSLKSFAWRWAVVILPLGWGVWQVTIKSLALFK